MESATETLEERIRQRAYQLWEASGRPPGRDQEYWHRACELTAIEGTCPAGAASSAIVHVDSPVEGKSVGPNGAGRKRREVAERSTEQNAPRRRRRKT